MAPPPPEAAPTGSVESAITATQGISYQGISYQGISYQGISYQGISYQGISYQGASYGGVALSDATVSGSALVVWRQRPDLTWEQRFPDKLCLWNAARTVQTSCTTVNLATAASPLAGATWQAVFTQPDGTTVQVAVQIGASATQVGAVQRDTALGAAPAMFALNGSTAAGTRVDGTPGAACSLIPQGQRVGPGPICDTPGGCRANCDVWLYDVRLPGSPDAGGQPLGLCPAGESATALAGTWDATGKFTPSSTLFTFACTSGTIAKCTRWGYRPWDTAYRSDGSPSALAPYHQACVRAATADYCADGTSWTRNGTLVDVYDFYPAVGPAVGFIERTRGGVVGRDAATAFVWESSFDQAGATQIDHTRYMGIRSSATPSLECQDRYALDHESSGGGLGSMHWDRGGGFGSPIVLIDSTPVCAHSELLAGAWLHIGCSTCAAVVHDRTVRIFNSQTGTVTITYPYEYCTLPGNHWDSGCVQAAQAFCTASQRMALHSECTTGPGIGKYASGCALTVQLINGYEYCASTWDSNCVDAANRHCTSGLESIVQVPRPGMGFCGTQIPPIDD
ncbi:MAG TPA: ADYC domain-containing protein [Kofleriaceae bacterium]|jgi:hypothetical protein|nr:ADYC domain-containing protein [Kofleriaceae bacterium]